MYKGKGLQWIIRDYIGEGGLQMKNTEEYRRATGGVTIEG